jgi:predicted ester cyclase
MRSRDNLLCRWFDELWNQGDVTAIARLGTPGMRAHGADGTTRTMEEFVAWTAMMRAAIPDIRVEIAHTVDAGSSIAVHWIATGTHTGSTAALGPATGRPIRVEGLSIARVEHGRLVDGYDDYDYVGLLSQLGAAV